MQRNLVFHNLRRSKSYNSRVGTRKEGQPDNDPNDFRLVFEIEFVKQLFKDYKPAELKIWHAFTDTDMKTVLSF